MTWIVTCEMHRGVLDYYLENSKTGERRGTYDCEAWAQKDADKLNKQEEDGESSEISDQVIGWQPLPDPWEGDNNDI